MSICRSKPRLLVAVLLTFSCCARNTELANSTKPSAHQFTFFRKELNSPFPWNAHDAANVDVDAVRRVNFDSLLWHALTGTKFFQLPGDERFDRNFRAYGWSLAKGNPLIGLNGSIVTDLQDRIVLWKRDLTPSFFAALDIQQDGDLDLILRFREYGNHGNGSESDVLYLNRKGTFEYCGSVMTDNFDRGQDTRRGRLTWVERKDICAILVGEELETSGKDNYVETGKAFSVLEIYVIGEFAVKLATREIGEISKSSARFLTFR